MSHRLVAIAACLSSACAPMTITRTSTPIFSHTVVLDERPLPDRDQFTVAGQRQDDCCCPLGAAVCAPGVPWRKRSCVGPWIQRLFLGIQAQIISHSIGS
jgi:hypothetical protein